MSDNLIDTTILAGVVTSFMDFHWASLAGFFALILALMRIVKEYPKFLDAIHQIRKRRKLKKYLDEHSHKDQHIKDIEKYIREQQKKASSK